jgi:hypothetical protein
MQETRTSLVKKIQVFKFKRHSLQQQVIRNSFIKFQMLQEKIIWLSPKTELNL